MTPSTPSARRTYGTGDPDDDDPLPPYTETDEDGATNVYHGTGAIDIEATAELAARTAPTRTSNTPNKDGSPA